MLLSLPLAYNCVWVCCRLYDLHNLPVCILLPPPLTHLVHRVLVAHMVADFLPINITMLGLVKAAHCPPLLICVLFLLSDQLAMNLASTCASH